jgi:hypothetical protein
MFPAKVVEFYSRQLNEVSCMNHRNIVIDRCCKHRHYYIQGSSLGRPD